MSASFPRKILAKRRNLALVRAVSGQGMEARAQASRLAIGRTSVLGFHEPPTARLTGEA